MDQPLYSTQRPANSTDHLTVDQLLDLYFPHRTPANIRSDEEQDVIDSWLSAYFGDDPDEAREVTSLDYGYGDCCDNGSTEYEIPLPTGYNYQSLCVPEEIGTEITPMVAVTTYEIHQDDCGGTCYDEVVYPMSIGVDTQTDGSTNYYYIYDTAISVDMTNVIENIESAIIKKAVLIFTSASTASGPLEVDINGRLDPADVNLRPVSEETVNRTQPIQWEPGNWTDGVTYTSPDISCLLNYILGLIPSMPNTYYDYSDPASTNWVVVHVDTHNQGGGAVENYSTRTFDSVILKYWVQNVFDETMTGGVVCGGSATTNNGLTYDETMTGGVVVSGRANALNEGTHPYRVSITVPAGKVTETLHNFLLPVNVTLPGMQEDYIRVTDTDDNLIYHDVRQYNVETQNIQFMIKATITTDGWSGWIYYGGTE